MISYIYINLNTAIGFFGIVSDWRVSILVIGFSANKSVYFASYAQNYLINKRISPIAMANSSILIAYNSKERAFGQILNNF